MNIWLINHYAVPPKYYPLARQTYFARHLMALGHTVTIFAASTVHNSDKNLITGTERWRQETVDGVHYVYIKCLDYQGNGLKRMYNICEFAWKLPGVCKKFPRPDAIVATSMPPTSCAVGVHLARKYGCRGIAEIADLWPESIVAYGIAGPHNPAVLALRRLEKWIYRKADAVVFTMEGAYDYIKERKWEKAVPRSKVFYINNGVDLEQFHYNQEHFRIEDPDLEDPETIKVVYTGSIRKVNHLGALLDAAKQVQDSRIRFLIWGDGDELPALRRRLQEEGIQNVIFKGRVGKKYIPSIVSRADYTYINGGDNDLLRFGISPNKLFDYFAAGKPLIMYMRVKYNPAERFSCGLTCQTEPELLELLKKLPSISGENYAALCRGAEAGAREYSFENLTKKLLNVIEGIGE